MQVTSEELHIVRLFRDKVYGKKADTSLSNDRHDGKKGHWLETKMGVLHNRSTAPDLFGYEMKDGTSSKISFGDWSADYYIFNDLQYTDLTKPTIQRRNESFLYIFGKPNPLKLGSQPEGRYSWSGEPIPKINQVNTYGVTLEVDRSDNILICYDYSSDTRNDKAHLVPLDMQQNNLLIASWNSESLRKKVNDKFNQNGWFVCKKDTNGIYNQIAFGAPIPFETWINMVKTGEIFFDSGMYETNPRPYSQWRAYNTTLEKLFIRSYPDIEPFPVD